MLEHNRIARVRITPSLAPTYVAYDPAEKELTYGLGGMLIDDDLIIDLPTKDDEERIIDQLIGLLCAKPSIGVVDAHKALRACCPCTPIRICLLDPTGSRWRALYGEAQSQIDSGACAEHRRKNKLLLVESAKALLGRVPKWLLPKTSHKG